MKSLLLFLALALLLPCGASAQFQVPYRTWAPRSSSCLTFYPVDTFINMNGTAVGTAVTKTNLATATEITANYNGFSTASTKEKFGASLVAMPAGITINGGSTHACGYATQSLAHTMTSGSFSTTEMDFPGSHTQVTVSGWIINTPPDLGSSAQLYDLTAVVGGINPFDAVVQIANGTSEPACTFYGIEIEASGGTTAHSPCIAISPASTYYYTMFTNYTSSGTCNGIAAPCAEMNVYTTSGATFTQVGSTVAVALGGNDVFDHILYGNNEFGTFSGTLSQQNMMVDYTNHVFPNIPH